MIFNQPIGHDENDYRKSIAQALTTQPAEETPTAAMDSQSKIIRHLRGQLASTERAHEKDRVKVRMLTERCARLEAVGSIDPELSNSDLDILSMLNQKVADLERELMELRRHPRLLSQGAVEGIEIDLGQSPKELAWHVISENAPQNGLVEIPTTLSNLDLALEKMEWIRTSLQKGTMSTACASYYMNDTPNLHPTEGDDFVRVMEAANAITAEYLTDNIPKESPAKEPRSETGFAPNAMQLLPGESHCAISDSTATIVDDGSREPAVIVVCQGATVIVKAPDGKPITFREEYFDSVGLCGGQKATFKRSYDGCSWNMEKLFLGISECK